MVFFQSVSGQRIGLMGKTSSRVYNMDFAIVDLQGFRDNMNNFIVKELAFATRNLKFSDIIKSTCELSELNAPTRKTAEWLTQNYHGLAWTDGCIDIDELRETIKPILRTKTVYVKGEEKQKWLRKLLNNDSDIDIVNIEEIGCNLNLRKGPEVFGMLCPKHHRMRHVFCCALNNVMKIKDWYLSYLRENRYQ